MPRAGAVRAGALPDVGGIAVLSAGDMGVTGEPRETRNLPRAGAAIRGTSLRVVGLIGGGELGVVFLCDDEALRRQVVVKMLRPDRADPRRIATFLELMRSAARVISPHVASIYDVGLHDGLPFAVTEHIPGEPLDVHRRGRGGRLPVRSALYLADGMLRGLEALHGENLQHGAIGPSNVLVAPDGRVVITDVGMANVAVASLRPVAAAAVGFRPTTAGEDELRTVDAARRFDVCAVASLLYELVTGSPPRRTPGGRLVTPSELVRIPMALDEAIVAVLDDPRSPLRSVRVLRLSLEAVAKRLGDEQRFARVLLVDADDRSAGETERALGRIRASIDTSRVTSARMALHSGRETSWDLVIVSPNLPDMSGFEIVSSLAALDGVRKAPLVVLAQQGSAQDYRLLHGLGATTVLPLPMDVTLLTAILEGQLEANAPARSRRH